MFDVECIWVVLYSTHIQLHNSPWGFQSWLKGAEPSSTLQLFTDSRAPPQAMFPGDWIKTAPLPHTLSLLDAARGVGHSVLALLIFLSGSSTQIGISLRLVNLPLPPILYQVPSCSPFNKQDLTSFSLVPSHENTTIITILKMMKTGMEWMNANKNNTITTILEIIGSQPVGLYPFGVSNLQGSPKTIRKHRYFHYNS